MSDHIAFKVMWYTVGGFWVFVPRHCSVTVLGLHGGQSGQGDKAGENNSENPRSETSWLWVFQLRDTDCRKPDCKRPRQQACRF